MRPLLHHICLLLLCGLRLYAQNKTVPYFEHIGIENGLPSNTVNCTLEDKQGFMWFGTRKGLCRYDGYEFQSFNINQSVQGLAQTADGTIYASTDENNLIAINSVSGRATIIDKGGSGGGHNTFADSFDNVWYSDRNGVNRYQPTTHKTTHYPLKKTTYIWHKGNFVEDSKRNFWVLGLEVGLFKFDRNANRLRCIVGIDCPRKGLFDAGNMDLYKGLIDSQQILWTGGSKGLLQYDIAHDSFKFFYDASLVFTVAEGNNSSNERIIWFGTDKGVGVFNPKTQESKVLSGIFPFPFTVNQIVKSKNGNVWFCTSEGLLLYSPYKQAIQSLKLPSRNFNNRDNNINAILQDKSDHSGQTFWLLSAFNGLWKWNRATNDFKHFAVPHYDSNFEGLWLCQDNKNHIWVGGNQWAVWNDGQIDKTADPHREGVFLFDPHKEQFLDTPLKNHHTFFSVGFYSLGKIDRQNRLWLINHYEGIHVSELATGKELSLWSKASHDEIMKNGNWIMAIFEDHRGRIWLGTNRGLWYFDEANKHLVNVNIKPFNPSEAETAILKISEDKTGFLWAVGWGLVLKIDETGKILKRWSNDDGLFDKECRQVAIDTENKIWIGSYDGLQQYDEQKNKFRRLTIENGLLSNNTMAGFWNKNNELIIGSNGGLNVIDIAKTQITEPQQIPQFSKILVNSKPINTEQTTEINLKRYETNIQFVFTALNFEKKYLNQYDYYLENWEKTWQKTTQNSATYSNLSPGHYVFHVKQGNGQERTYQFAIAPYWYETAWSRMLFGLLIVGVGFYFLLSRARYKRLFLKLKIEESERLKKDQELVTQQAEFKHQITQTEIKALRAQMNPHFIFNCLNSIQLFTVQNNTEKASDYLTKFSRLIRLVLENSRSEKVTLANELETLRLYIELEAMRFRDKFKYQINVSDSIDQSYIEIPPLLLQPFVENAIWHGLMHKEEGGTVIVEVEQQSVSALHVTITDDGVGREKATEFKSKSATRNKSFGMKVTSERIELINQLYNTNTQVSIIDLKDKNGNATGTKVIIEIPI